MSAIAEDIFVFTACHTEFKSQLVAFHQSGVFALLFHPIFKRYFADRNAVLRADGQHFDRYIPLGDRQTAEDKRPLVIVFDRFACREEFAPDLVLVHALLPRLRYCLAVQPINYRQFTQNGFGIVAVGVNIRLGKDIFGIFESGVTEILRHDGGRDVLRTVYHRIGYDADINLPCDNGNGGRSVFGSFVKFYVVIGVGGGKRTCVYRIHSGVGTGLSSQFAA